MKHKLIQLISLTLITTFIWQVLVLPTPWDGSSGDRSKIRNGDRSEFSFENVPKILRPRAAGERGKGGNVNSSIPNHLETDLRISVDSRDLAKAEQLVSQIQSLSEGTKAILLECPRETSPIELKKLTDLNEDVIATLMQNGITDGSAIFAVRWTFDESATNILRHVRDNLKDEDADKPIFGIIIVRIIQERDGIKLEFIFQDNGGGQDVEQLYRKITAATTSEGIETPSGRGILLTTSFVFTEFGTSGFYDIISQGKRLTFTGFDEEHGPQTNPPVGDSTINNGFLAHIGFKIPFVVVRPLNHGRNIDSAISSSILRPLAAGEGESRAAREDVLGSEGRPVAAGEREW